MTEPPSPPPGDAAAPRPAPGTLTTITAVQEWISRLHEIPARARRVEDRAYLAALRRRLHELRGARLASEEAKLREAQRKAETQRKIQLGGLVIKAGLDGWDEATLLGALAAVREAASEPPNGPACLARWKARGGTLLAAATAAPADREPLIIVFPQEPPLEIRRALRGLKMRWSEALRQWDGLASFEAVKAIADQAGGTVHRVKAPTAGSATPPVPENT